MRAATPSSSGDVNILAYAGARAADLGVARDLAMRHGHARAAGGASAAADLASIFDRFKRQRGARRRGASHRSYRIPLRLRLKMGTAAADDRKRKRGGATQPASLTSRLSSPSSATPNAARSGMSTTMSRRWRRRRGDFSRCRGHRTQRQQLPTHKWHAKRFHFEGFPIAVPNTMSQFATVRLPQQSVERGTRSALHTATTACMMHDASYIHCVHPVYVCFIVYVYNSRAAA